MNTKLDLGMQLVVFVLTSGLLLMLLMALTKPEKKTENNPRYRKWRR